MRVRTYGFPGCFTRPPGTSTRHHPHEPTTSKPVVPGDVCYSIKCSRDRKLGNRGERARTRRVRQGRGVELCRAGSRPQRRRCESAPERRRRGPSVRERKRRGPEPLEEPSSSSPRAFRFRRRGLTPRWPRSLRFGSASTFSCTPLPERLQGLRQDFSAVSEEIPARDLRWRERRMRAASDGIVRHRLTVLRRCLSRVPQWNHDG
jgi:hypothetical protein